MNLTRRVLLLCALPILVLACSLPADDNATRLDVDELPEDLTDPTTTTTTTTTTTLPPVTSDPLESVATTTSTSTTIAPLAVGRVYYPIVNTDQVQALRRQLTDPPTLLGIRFHLETPLTDIGEYGLRTSLREGLIADMTFDRAVLTVSLDGDVFAGIPEPQQREAIAQIVLTFTSFTTADQGAVGSVVFMIDGEPIPVFVPASGTTSEPGAQLLFADFAPLILNESTTVTTTTTPTTPVETGPPPGSTAAP